MAIQLILFDCEKQVDIPVASTETVIGRDSILQCDDKRISRQHGIIRHDGELTGGSSSTEERTIQITSTHANPIFLRTADQVLNILTKDLTATLRHGEKFALLPDQYWFEVRFRDTNGEEQPAGQEPVSSSSVGHPEEVAEVEAVPEEATGGTIRVRTMEEVNSVVAAAEERVLPDWIGGGGSGGGEKRKNGDDSEAESSKKARCEEEPVAVKADPDTGEASTSQAKPSDSAASTSEEAVKAEIKKETADSTSSPLRPSCEFGIRCYRRTVEHRTQFAHPNDSDYRRPTFAPAPSDAPQCPYGASCYRRNPQHFRDFQHPDSTTVQPAATVTSHQVPPGGGVLRNNMDPDGRRRRRRLARDIVIAAMANPNLFDDSDEDEDEDDGGDLFGDEDDSDEYLPGGGGRSDDDDDEDDEVDGIDILEDENEE